MPKIVEIDLELLEDLSRIACTDQEIAAIMDCSTKTIERRRKDDPEFRAACERGAADGKMSVRRAQLKSAIGGNVTAQIWLGKQWLGQRDMNRFELTGAEGQPIEVNHGDAFRNPDKIGEIAAGLAEMGAFPDASATREDRESDHTTTH